MYYLIELSFRTLRPMKRRPLSEIEALKLLKARGYTVRKGASYTKKTFEIDSEVLLEFIALRTRLGIKVKEAVNTALCDWIERYGGKTTPPSK